MESVGSPLRRRRFLQLLGGAALVAGCTPATESAKATAAAPATTVSQPSIAPTAQPKHPFTLLSFASPTNIDPAVAIDWPGRIHIIQAYESLFRYAPPASPGGPPRLIPHLAESVRASDDAKTYTVTLRPGVKFHDGTELDAAAVAFSMDRLLTIKKGAAASFRDFLQPGDTKALDKRTVQFNLRQPSGVFTSNLPFFFIVNPGIITTNRAPTGPYGPNGDYAEQYLQTKDAGSGPYVLKSANPTDETVFEAFPDYWRGWKENQFSSYKYKIVREPATAAQLIRQGQANMLYEFYAAQTFADLDTVPSVQVSVDSGVKALHFIMNSKRAPLNNLKVRQAIAYAFDYKQAIEGVMKGIPKVTRLKGLLPTWVFGALDTSPYDTNLDRARALIAESGLKPSDLTIEYLALGGPTDQRTKAGLLMQANLAQIGIKVDVVPGVFADVIKRVTQPETAMHMLSADLSMESNEPADIFYTAYHSSSAGSWNGLHSISNAELDGLLEKVRKTLRQEDRLPIYKQIQEKLFDLVPALFLFNEPTRVALSKDTGGYVYPTAFYNYEAYPLFKQS